MGGVSNIPAIFGEAGPEAAVPLPDGRSIPVTFTNDMFSSSLEDKLEDVATRLIDAILIGSQATVSEIQTSSDKNSEVLKRVEWEKRNSAELA